MDKTKIYEKARLNNRLGFGKRPALVVVDLVKGFTNPELPLGSDLRGVIQAVNSLVSAARSKKIPIIYSTIAYNPNRFDGGIWVKKAPAQAEFVIGSDLVEVDPHLDHRPQEDTYLVKKYASCFFGTDLAAMLTAAGVDTVILCGATTSGCVRATAVDAMQNGFIPIVPREAVGDRAEEPHVASLFDINAKYGDVVGLDEVLSYVRNLAEDK